MLSQFYDSVDGLVRPWTHRVHDLVGIPFRWVLQQTTVGRWIRRNTHPNHWSAVRFPLAIFTGVLLSVDLVGLAIIVFCLGVLTDRFDGEFARLDGLESDIGETIDTSADATLIAAVMWGFAHHWPPLVRAWPAFTLGHAVLTLEGIRLTGGLVLHSLAQTSDERRSLKPNMSGKFKTGALALAVLLIVGHLTAWSSLLARIGLWLSVYSLVRHLVDYSLARKQRPAAS